MLGLSENKVEVVAEGEPIIQMSTVRQISTWNRFMFNSF